MRLAVHAALALLASAGCEQILGINDLSVGSGGSGEHPDAAPHDGPGATVDGSKCSAASSYTPSFGASQQAVLEGGDPPEFTQRIQWNGNLSTSPMAALQLEMVGGGDTNTPDWPTMLGPIGELDLHNATDAVVLLLANFNNGTPQDIYLAEQGTLSVSDADATLGGKVDGIMANLTLVHVDAEGSGFVADPDGCVTTIDNAAFSTTVSGM